MRRLHETFVSLAGRLQSVHAQVESQKEQYLNLRRYMLHDDTNIFENPTKETKALNLDVTSITYKPRMVVTGPTPFNLITNQNVAAQSLQAQLAPPAYPGSATSSNNFP